MRKLILSLVALAVVASPIALTAAPASANAGSPLCMTKAEWYRIHDGLTQTQVKNIVGIWGKVWGRADYSDGEITFMREYRQCNAKGRPAPSWNTVDIDFTNVRGYDDDWNPIIGAAYRVDYKGGWYAPTY